MTAIGVITSVSNVNPTAESTFISFFAKPYTPKEKANEIAIHGNYPCEIEIINTPMAAKMNDTY